MGEEWGRPGVRHPTAVVHPDARVSPSASIAPYAVIGPGVQVEDDVRVGPHACIERDTRLGAGCRVGKGVVLGADPQDMKYAGESTLLVVGARTVIREHATLHRGTAASGRTLVGNDCLIMAYAHVAHDCRIGDHVVLANAVNLGGHVVVEEWASVGGLTAIHQFARVGRHAFVGGCSRVVQDVLPYVRVAGNPCAAYGLNLVGLRRRGFAPETVREIGRAYRVLFRSGMHLGRALEALEAEEPSVPEVERMITFARASERGLTVPRHRSRDGARGRTCPECGGDAEPVAAEKSGGVSGPDGEP